MHPSSRHLNIKHTCQSAGGARRKVWGRHRDSSSGDHEFTCRVVLYTWLWSVRFSPFFPNCTRFLTRLLIVWRFCLHLLVQLEFAVRRKWQFPRKLKGQLWELLERFFSGWMISSPACSSMKLLATLSLLSIPHSSAIIKTKNSCQQHNLLRADCTLQAQKNRTIKAN